MNYITEYFKLMNVLKPITQWSFKYAILFIAYYMFLTILLSLTGSGFWLTFLISFLITPLNFYLIDGIYNWLSK